MKVRTRVAPSPTGDPHVGTAYVALINWCFAKHHGGDFLLRIEDTDRARSTLESEKAILDSLHWFGIGWDEGPDIGGPHGPYRQSERSDIYKQRAQTLLEAGHAFKCYCTPERLEEMREAQKAAKQPPHYDGHCLKAAPPSPDAPFVVRMKVPTDGACVFDDALRGRITVEWKTVDMQVLLKADGFPTYHLANVVDDHAMEITHVIRGEEWISSAPKHILLYQYFGWEAPSLCHLPLLRNPDKSKLSKRKNPTSILFYKGQGFLAQALMNFLGILIDARNDNPEFIGNWDGLLDAIKGHFDLKRIALGGPVFDIPKLTWLNGQWIRNESVDAFMQRLADFGFEWPASIPSGQREHIARIAQSRIETLADLAPAIGFFGARPVLDTELMQLPKATPEQARAALGSAREALAATAPWDEASIGNALKTSTQEKAGVKFKDVARLFYIAITGSPTGLPLFDDMAILGKEESLARIDAALEALK